jgi:type IV pilus assembly protein PilO
LQVVTGELRVLESAVRTLPKIKEELRMLERKWEVLRGLLPLASEMSMLLSDVTTAGMKAGVEFVLFEPGAPELYDLYTRYPINVAVTGGYHEVGRFFDNMCNMDRLVGLSNIGIMQISAGEEPVTVEASLMVSAYTYNVNQVGTAAKSQAQGTEGTR